MTEEQEDLSNVTPPPKVRRAELITPPNRLKEKVGSGGLDKKLISEAQGSIDDNAVNFHPIAEALIKLIDEAVRECEAGTLKGEAAIENIIYPAMQLKAQGTMFHFPLVTEISNILVNFLETVTVVDKDMLDIVKAHEKTIQAVLSQDIHTDGGPMGQELRDALMDACNRFYRSRSG